MPRSEIELPYRIEYLSILDENGNLDKELEPDIPDDILVKLHREMLSGRRFDERMLNLQRQGRIGTFPPIKGQEASQLGAVATLKNSDWMVPAFREALAEFWRGKPRENFILFYGGYDEGGAVEEGRNDLPVAIPVGSQMLHAVGIGMGIQYRRKDDVVMTFFGDGATSEGDFHEALNFAGVFQAPVIFICQNNQWAISVPRSRQTHAKTLAQKALAHGLPGIQVDGNDVLAVYAAAREAVERARTGKGPTLIECFTYRMSLHTTADDPKKYRSEDEVKEWEKRDPIPRFQAYLTQKGLLTDEVVEQLEADIAQEIQGAIDRAEKLMAREVDPLDMFNHTFAELPPSLILQRQEAELDLSLRKEEDRHD
ncbi:MAG: pyruvate dehydrogenase (acetyl-transferring) E1 component subunit alpha [Desulfobulbaceae bacterium]|uniref:Pyruvate dehydrogenase E1 component subunit alpha n=1 Tax=Candidatus Desulfobia pelagia TaxID=2841692 RepID=A0A8J6TF53_9BACT|nr:pyruvate dehydrogenase (acetyl-transferring) E1 component subunit alpha [Candidatus Desulfobia pelagia]